MEKNRIIKTSGLFILLCVVAFCVEFYYANNTKNIILPEKSEIYTVTVTIGCRMQIMQPSYRRNTSELQSVHGYW